MSTFKVEKREVSVRIAHTDGTTVSGSVYLAPESPFHAGGQTMRDLMDEKSAFLPVKNDRGDFVLLGKEGIVYVINERQEGEPEEFVRRVSARMRLAGGHTLNGELIAPVGDAAFRVSDYLNGPDEWLRLEREDAIYWIRRGAILEIRI